MASHHRATRRAKPAGVQYAQVRHDDADEHLDPYYSRTLEITEEHYGCLRDFAEEPAEFEFDVGRPAPSTAAAISSGRRCIRGLHPLPAPLDGGSNLGEFAVLFNLPEIQCIAAPFPGSDLNAETHHAMPEREAEHHRQGDRATDEPPPTPIEVAGTLLDPSHPDHRLFSQLIQKVAELDAAHGRRSMRPASASAPACWCWPSRTISRAWTTCCSAGRPKAAMRRRASSSCRGPQRPGAPPRQHRHRGGGQDRCGRFAAVEGAMMRPLRRGLVVLAVLGALAACRASPAPEVAPPADARTGRGAHGCAVHAGRAVAEGRSDCRGHV